MRIRREEKSPAHGHGVYVWAVASGGGLWGKAKEKVQEQKWAHQWGENSGEKKGYYGQLRGNQVTNGFKYQGEEFGFNC